MQEKWPALPYGDWKDTRDTLHLWTQVVGKVKLALNPYENHWWHISLSMTARGLTTGPVPCNDRNGRVLEIQFDFIDHELRVLVSDGVRKVLPLIPRSVAEFYREFTGCLRALEIDVVINPLPSEIASPIPCDQDEQHASYDPVYAARFWRILLETAMVLKRHRSRFIGKSSPIHFFWGGFDLALSFFSGRRAPERKGADLMTREGYSHEVISCGFWPGSEAFQEPAFYAYAAPVPPGLESVPVLPAAAFFHPQLREFLLRYEDVRTAPDPGQALLDFCGSTYEASANLSGWDRAALEKHGG
jgi:Family of unknown function (DUF5996)